MYSLADRYPIKNKGGKPMKKTLSMLLVLVMVLALSALASAENYTIVSYQSSSQGRQPDENDPILKVLEDKFNADIQINVITSEYQSKLNLEVASGNTPDIMKVSAAQFRSFLDQDLLLPIEDYVEKMPNFMALYPDVLEDPTLRVDGHLYFLRGNKPAESIIKSYWSLWIRKDWLDKLSLEIPTTLDEFKNVAIAFATQDPDGNGVNDTFGYTGLNEVNNGYMDPILGAFGVGQDDFILDAEGNLVYSAATEAYRDALAWMKDFIATGAVDPDISLMTTFDAVREKVYRNQVGMMYFSWAEFVKPPYDQTLAEMTPNAEWIQIDAPIGPAGKNSSCYNVPGFANSGWVLSADLADNPEKLDLILRYLDYITTGEGSDLVCYGVEGTHFNYVDGKVVTTDRISEVSFAWQHQLMGRDEINYLAIKFPTCSEEIATAAGYNRINAYDSYVSIPDGQNKADLTRYVTEETTRFIYGTRDLATWEDYKSNLYNLYGLQEYIDIGIENLKGAGII
jgi:putative aldouronate transport system substrate-binding protein